MNPIDRLQEVFVTSAWIIVPILLLIGIAAQVIERNVHGPGKLERALLDRLKGMK